jgi:hypothetical protein
MVVRAQVELAQVAAEQGLPARMVKQPHRGTPVAEMEAQEVAVALGPAEQEDGQVAGLRPAAKVELART